MEEVEDVGKDGEEAAGALSIVVKVGKGAGSGGRSAHCC